MAKLLKVRITFMDEVLGGLPSDGELYDTFIASNAPDAMSREEEIEVNGLQETIQKGTTIFPRDAKGAFLYNYQIQGFFKAACKALRSVKESKSKNVKAYKKVIDQLISIADRRNYITGITGEGYCQRPLRGSTPQGETVSIAKSESIAAGAQVEFTVCTLNDDYCDLVEEWLDYGMFVGIGQWRNSGKGRFDWEKVEDWRDATLKEAREMIKI